MANILYIGKGHCVDHPQKKADAFLSEIVNPLAINISNILHSLLLQCYQQIQLKI